MSTPPALAAAASAALDIVLDCPKCGAPIAVSEDTVTRRCEHCGSRFMVSAPERDEVYLAPRQVKDADSVLALAQEYRVAAYRAEVVSRHKDGEGNPPSESFIAGQLAAHAEQLRRRARLITARALAVPYWHLSGAVVQVILGRRHDSPKQLRLRAFAVEHTVPGYDLARANLRDRGLRLSGTRVRPLRLADLEAGPRFLPRVALGDRSYRDIDKWKAQDLDPSIVAAGRYGVFRLARRVLVYRWYWLARLVLDRGEEWLLIDASFRTVAGHPEAAEVEEMTRLTVRDPLEGGKESFLEAVLIASRCPDCGHEQEIAASHQVFFCVNCHLGLQPHEHGIRSIAYAHATGDALPDGGEHLPFWRFALKLELASRPPIARLEEYVDALCPGAKIRARPAGEALWIPAVRLLGTEPGDEAFQALVEWVHTAGLEVRAGKVPLGVPAVLRGASVGEGEARTLGTQVLLALLGKEASARLGTLSLKRAAEARLTLGAGSLVLVPFAADGKDLRIPGVAAPLARLLLEGGPELARLKASVHGRSAG